ncbi:MAG: hypothetical protein WBO17_16315 [Sphingorhabdus sp.]
MRKSVPNDQIRAIAMAMGGAIVASVATMFVPATVLESITGSIGLSELVPQAAAPLGDTARAIIAFGIGAFTLAALSFILLRQESPTKRPVMAALDTNAIDDVDTDDSSKERLSRFKLPRIAIPQFPWVRSHADIVELADLPKLKNGDGHPDAPPRRPISAAHDLPTFDQVEIEALVPIETAHETEVEPAPVATPAAAAAESIAANHETMKMAVQSDNPASPVLAREPEPSDVVQVAIDAQPTLAEMVAQLEAAVTERQKQLADLEIVAARLAEENQSTSAASTAMGTIESAAPILDDEFQPASLRVARAPLEVVPSTPVKDDDMEGALAAALATLHRMNGAAR